ncbi:leucine carboxyl methyltransferase 1 [Cylas formicarius]|uniref:leucine carboxyl methyltransferase 1 n=1 Tax=Cylas formicarius TaxID=197179 RepID=UPI0029586BB1|nr:leucine carboxyl methyltransferase 1 [Cylas formicarius]XP_060524034.1 leucine carboxyl methyltransferase 1 [Cylas formicarius]XP_060524035.1 leucine carboxyl methyltransferase 1 [Cylas formicarius]
MGDQPVIATNDDASECKRGAVQLGYWTDNYISYFVKHTERRAPEINRGYFARIKSVDSFVQKFISRAGSTAQIVNFGAGFDTLYWRLKDEGVVIANYTELDFPTVTSKKCYVIKRNKPLLDRIYEQDGEVFFSPVDLHSGNYHCLGVDLRNIAQLKDKLNQAQIKFDRPTLFIAECVLVYIESECVNRLLAWISSSFESGFFVNYEMCNINDTFGDIMLGNLKARGCSLAGISQCKNLDTQKGRFVNNGWAGAKAWDMVQVYHSIDATERHRIEKIEFLDERELLVQLFQHYCICVGWLGQDFADFDID